MHGSPNTKTFHDTQSYHRGNSWDTHPTSNSNLCSLFPPIPISTLCAICGNIQEEAVQFKFLNLGLDSCWRKLRSTRVISHQPRLKTMLWGVVGSWCLSLWALIHWLCCFCGRLAWLIWTKGRKSCCTRCVSRLNRIFTCWRGWFVFKLWKFFVFHSWCFRWWSFFFSRWKQDWCFGGIWEASNYSIFCNYGVSQCMSEFSHLKTKNVIC